MAPHTKEFFAAVKAGNVECLKLFEAADKDNVEYLKSLCKTPEGKLQAEDARCYQNNPNILHVAVANNNGKFVHAICERLSIQKMLLDKDDSGDTPLHDAATFKRKEIAKVLVDAYITACAGNNDTNLNLPTSHPPPWRVRNNNFQTPADIALTVGEDDLAGFLLSPENPDIGLSGGKIIDPLRGAVRLKRGDIQHLISAPDDIISFGKKFGESEAVNLLFENLKLAKIKGDFTGKTVLHMAAENNMVEVTKAVLKIDITTASTLDQLKEENCFHVAARMGSLEIARVLVHMVGASGLMKPWRQKDKDGNTPLHLALLHEQKEIAAFLISEDGTSLYAETNKKNQSPLTLAMDKCSNFKQIVEQIVALEVPLHSIAGFTPQMLVTFAKEFSEDKTRNLIKQHPEVIDLDHGQTNILHYALQENCGSVVALLLEIYPDAAIDKDAGSTNDENLMFKACSKGDVPVIRAMCRYCPRAARIKDQYRSTALHHVKLRSLEEYEHLLAIPEFSRLKNFCDVEKRTPLMKAIRDGNTDLAEALLKMKGVDVMILKDKDGKTAADMLEEKAKEYEEWGELYVEYARDLGINVVGEVRHTLSVVATLIATITFAAAFTVPGGFDSKSGQIVLGHRASVIIFILSDTYAFCCSMTVIHVIAFTMSWSPHKALLYIERSVFALRQSLYGTLVAFISGIYSVEVGKTLWVVIIAAFMCCLVPFYEFLLASSNKSASYLITRYIARGRGRGDHHRDEDWSNNGSDRV